MATTDDNTDFEDDDYEYEEEKSSSSRIIIILLIIASVLLAGLAGFMFYKKTESEKTEKVAVEQRDKIEMELKDLEGKLVSLQDTISASNTEKEALKSQIVSLRRRLARVQTNKTELLNLRAEVQGLKTRIEQLKKENSELLAKNQELTSNLENTAKEKSEAMDMLKSSEAETSRLKQRIQKASVLKVSGINVQTIRYKRNREIVEDRAKKIDLIKVEFSIAQNEFTPDGKYKVFISIVDPNGETLTDPNLGEDVEQAFIFIDNNRVPVTFDLNVDYKSSDINPPYPTNYDVYEEVLPGVYTVRVYSDVNLMGTTTFELY